MNDSEIKGRVADVIALGLFQTSAPTLAPGLDKFGVVIRRVVVSRV